MIKKEVVGYRLRTKDAPYDYLQLRPVAWHKWGVTNIRSKAHMFATRQDAVESLEWNRWDLTSRIVRVVRSVEVGFAIRHASAVCGTAHPYLRPTGPTSWTWQAEAHLWPTREEVEIFCDTWGLNATIVELPVPKKPKKPKALKEPESPRSHGFALEDTCSPGWYAPDVDGNFTQIPHLWPTIEAASEIMRQRCYTSSKIVGMSSHTPTPPAAPPPEPPRAPFKTGFAIESNAHQGRYAQPFTDHFRGTPYLWPSREVAENVTRARGYQSSGIVEMPCVVGYAGAGRRSLFATPEEARAFAKTCPGGLDTWRVELSPATWQVVPRSQE
jgi:hypothetical protein